MLAKHDVNADDNLLCGQIAAAYGRHYEVVLAGAQHALLCFPRGKKSAAAVGEQVALYRRLSYQVLELSVCHSPQATLAQLRPLLYQRVTLLAGQSGMGKSSLVNLLVPHAQAATREISHRLNAGRHTTSFIRLF